MSTDDAEDCGPPDLADERVGPLGLLLQAIDSQRLRNCLQGLEPAQRQAIALAFYDGLTHVELAAHMRQPRSSCRNRWPRTARGAFSPCRP